jgi:spore coat polysaccharide biosynthesis protein SpsF
MAKKIVSITQARLSSSRFPSKVIQKVNGLSMIDLHLERINKSKLINNRVLAIGDEENASTIIESLKNKKGILFSFGSVADVLDRFYQAVVNIEADYVVRLTSDCPLIDPALIDQVIEFAIAGDYDYVSNALEPTFPDGMDAEVFRKEVLVEAWKKATEPKDREHVTPYIWKSFFDPIKNFKVGSYKNDQEDLSNFRLTLDYEEDFLAISHLIKHVGPDANYKDYVSYLKNNPDIYKINSKFIRNEGF